MFVNKSGQTIRMSDIPTSWLCPNCWALITDFCEAAKKVDKVELNPVSNNILKDIMRHSNRTKNPILQALFRDLKIKIRGVLNQPGKQNRIFLLLMQLASDRSQMHTRVSA